MMRSRRSTSQLNIHSSVASHSSRRQRGSANVQVTCSQSVSDSCPKRSSARSGCASSHASRAAIACATQRCKNRGRTHLGASVSGFLPLSGGPKRVTHTHASRNGLDQGVSQKVIRSSIVPRIVFLLVRACAGHADETAIPLQTRKRKPDR